MLISNFARGQRSTVDVTFEMFKIDVPPVSSPWDQDVVFEEAGDGLKSPSWLETHASGGEVKPSHPRHSCGASTTSTLFSLESIPH